MKPYSQKNSECNIFRRNTATFYLKKLQKHLNYFNAENYSIVDENNKPFSRKCLILMIFSSINNHN